MHRSEPLPVEDALPALLAALATGTRAVLAAPPGAGKTTRVPPALADAAWARGRIVVLEPRRLAARAAAERMAAERGQPTGRDVGYRIRGESRAGSRIEVVTEGVLTRMLQSDPELPGVAAVVFDEIHERSIQSDLGLALALEVQAALRPDLRILAMSATLDTDAVSALMGGAPVIASAGRLHPVETRWQARPAGPRAGRFEDRMAALVRTALTAAPGDVLAFLPGAGEIARIAERLSDAGAGIVPLHGGLSFARQKEALAPQDAGRRVVLATSIAETSLTVPGVRIVVDGGLARRSETDPATGLSRLVTRPVSRAEADQRRGRAAREGPGVCYRLWAEVEHGALPAFAPPEILTADLAPLALELAAWGAEPDALAFADPPPPGALAEARALLAALGALDADARITPAGRDMAALPVHPRLARMLVAARVEGLAAEAGLLAALLGERDLLAVREADLLRRVRALFDRGDGVDRGRAERVLAEARRLGGRRPDRRRTEARGGALLAVAYPDRIALRRPGETPRFLMAGGRGARLDPADALAASPLLVAVDLEDTRPEATIRRAVALDERDLRAVHGAAIGWHETIAWDARQKRVVARGEERFGRLVLATRALPRPDPDAVAAALADGVRASGISALLGPGAERLRARAAWLARQDDSVPDLSDPALEAALETWLVPCLAGLWTLDDVRALDMAALLAAWLGPEVRARLDRAAPEAFRTPLGRQVPIDYDRETPTLSVRAQEMYGVTRHPCAGEPPVPLVIELLSPAGRPIQITRDLPGFWTSSWADVRKDMRARYPKHDWPEAPAEAAPSAGPRRRA